MILDNKIIPQVICEVTEDSFHMDSTKLIFEHLEKVWKREKLVDLVMIKDSLGNKIEEIGGIEFLADVVASVPNVASWSAYLKVLSRRARQREQVKVAQEILEHIEEDGEDDKVYELADSIKRSVSHAEGKSLGEVVQDGIEILEGVRTIGREMSWGWEELDRNVGGLRRKTTYVIGGKTSQGKTTVVSNLVVNALKEGKKVLMSVLENPDQVALRLASIDSNVPLSWFLKPDQVSDANFASAKGALEALRRWDTQLKVVGATPLALLKSMAEKFKPDIVILDYLQKYAARYCVGTKGTKASEVGRAASDFGDIAIDCNAAGILLSQVSRRTEDTKGRRPVMEDLKESGDIENYADVIMMLYWPWRDTRSEKKDPLLYEIDIAKNKLGPPQVTLSLRINPETLRITDWNKEKPSGRTGGESGEKGSSPVRDQLASGTPKGRNGSGKGNTSGGSKGGKHKRDTGTAVSGDVQDSSIRTLPA